MKSQKIQYCLLFSFLFPLFLSAQQRTFTHINKNGGHHTSTVINYKSWKNKNWWAKVDGNTFTIARKSTFVNSRNKPTINYISWNGTKWVAKVDGDTWTHAPNGKFNKAHQSKIIKYLTPDGAKWTATFESYQEYMNAEETPSPTAPERTFTHISKKGGHHASTVINYKSWKKKDWWAKVNGNTFTIARKSTFANSRNEATINYITWNGTKWTAKLDGDTWIHAPKGDFSKAHQSKIINYLTPDRAQWTATFESYQEYTNVNGTPPPIEPDGIILITQPIIIDGTFSQPPVVLPSAPTLNIGSLADVCPNASSLSLFKDLGLFDRIADIPTFDVAKALCPLAQQALDNYTQNLAQYKSQLPSSIANNLNAGNLRESIKNHTAIKNAVNGVLFTLMINTITNTSDQSSGARAIRTWAANIYKELNVMIAQNTLREYYRWEGNPCGYPGANCPQGLLALATTAKPPMDLFSENGMKSSFRSGATITGAVAMAGAAISVGISANVLVSTIVAVNGSLFMGTTAGIAASTIWAGPAGIIVAAVVAGVLEAINLEASLNAERKLLERVNSAENENVNINTVINNKEKLSLLLMSFMNLTTS